MKSHKRLRSSVLRIYGSSEKQSTQKTERKASQSRVKFGNPKISQVEGESTAQEEEELGKSQHLGLDLTPKALKSYWRILKQENDIIKVVFLDLSFHSGKSLEQTAQGGLPTCTHMYHKPHELFVTGKASTEIESGSLEWPHPSLRSTGSPC